MARSITVLALDPGKTNFGYCVTQFLGSGSFKPLIAGKLKNTITDMSNLVSHMDEYTMEIDGLLDYKPSVLVIERFMNRGKFSGDTGEYVGVMLGLAAFQARAKLDADVLIVQPGIWKTAFNRVLGWKSGKPTPLDKLYRFCLTEPHELDAYLMTHFGYGKVTNTSPFSLVKSKSKQAFLTEFEAVAHEKKKRKRLQ